MKLIAFYLPQFHVIPENDQWWGKGFTEWTNTRKAKALFKGHYQPREPLNDNYYDLSDKRIMIWQADLAKYFGIYGFCYYHYWFNGKILLEKPLENMLASRSVDIPFCLSWANEPWTRRWDGLNQEVLMPQSYGSDQDWQHHFMYLAQYFKDNRYIMINNKPVFIIYRTKKIDNADAMINCWNELARNMGFEGLYIIETLNSYQKEPFIKQSSAVLEFEPMYTLTHFYPRSIKIMDIARNMTLYNRVNTKKYVNVWKQIIQKGLLSFDGRKTIPGAFIDWDNTPRMNNKGFAIRGANPEKFKYFFLLQLKKAIQDYKSDFLFINAWNEWAEGAYIEPDKRYGYQYLSAIKAGLDIVSEVSKA